MCGWHLKVRWHTALLVFLWLCVNSIKCLGLCDMRYMAHSIACITVALCEFYENVWACVWKCNVQGSILCFISGLHFAYAVVNHCTAVHKKLKNCAVLVQQYRHSMTVKPLSNKCWSACVAQTSCLVAACTLSAGYCTTNGDGVRNADTGGIWSVSSLKNCRQHCLICAGNSCTEMHKSGTGHWY